MADYKKNEFEFDYDDIFAADADVPEDLFSEEADDWQEEPAEWMEEELTPPTPRSKKTALQPEEYEEEDWEEESEEPEDEQQKLKRRKSRRRWRVFLLLWALFLLVVGSVGCFVLYQYLDAYEQSRPEHIMDDLMAATTPEQWYEHALNGFEPELSRFDDPEAIFAAYYDAALANANYTYRKDTANSTEDAPAYVIRAGAVELCRVKLEDVGDAGFGMNLWAAGDTETVFSLNSLQSMAVEIDAPADEAVFLNGVELGKEYIVDENVPCPNVTELEKRFTQQPSFVRYRVDAMYGTIRVTDSADNTLTTTECDGENTVRYLLPETDFHSVTITAPSDVIVTIGGAQLSAEDVTKSDAGVLEKMENYTGDGAYKTVTYQIDGLYTQPEITAVDKEGNALQPVINGENAEKITFFYQHDEELYEQTHKRVEEFFNNYMRYSQQAFSEGNYYALLGCILEGTELYSYIRDSVDAMYWASATEITYEELTFTDFYGINDSCFTCTVRYKADMAAKAWYESYTYGLQNAYQMLFVCVDGVWYAAAMDAV